jgi:hypothetical protein
VIEACIEYETMQAFGGYRDMLDAPREVVERTRLVLAGKAKAAMVQDKELAHEVQTKARMGS